MKNKATVNYIIDMLIGIGFLISIISGIVLLAAVQGGYQGGRNPAFNETIILFSRSEWKLVHNWSSMIAAGAAVVHFILHWNWIVCMTKKVFKRKKDVPECNV